MPELPEVEVLVRHLKPLIREKRIREVTVLRPKSIAPATINQFVTALKGARFVDLKRRGKYLVFRLRQGRGKPARVLGHLGMTGRMYVVPAHAPLPKHAAVVLGMGREKLVFEDTRYFGRITLDTAPLERLGPEPLGKELTTAQLAKVLQHSRQAVKVKLLDQSFLAGVGNIYACEALFRAGISPLLPGHSLTRSQIARLRRALRQVLSQAIRFGSTVPLEFGISGLRDGLFYFGSKKTAGTFSERLLMYDREGLPCPACQTAIRRIPQAGRSTYFCPACQPLKASIST